MLERQVLHPVWGTARSAVVMLDDEPIGFKAGGTEPKNFVTGAFGSYNISLIERLHEPELYERNWKAFKEAGLPVPPMLRKTPEGRLFVTDVKADGSEVYGKAFKILLETGQEGYRPRPEIDKLFLKLMRSHKERRKIEKSALECVNIATSRELILPSDGPFELVVHPNGTWDVMLLDLMLGDILPYDPRTYADTQQNISQYNYFISNLDYIDYLLRHK